MADNAINKNMGELTQSNVNPQSEKKPDEKGGILVQGYLKIFDPETKEEYVNGRA